MPLLSFWKNNSEAVLSMSVQQIVNAAGDGNLLDNSVCSQELRTYLGEVSSEKLGKYADQCLTKSFDRGGQVLQDIVNEMGRRLDYEVENGRYQGSSSHIGFDGLWHGPDKHDLLIEVKTSDSYRISLDTIARYRDRLLETGKLGQSNSILIVVGRKDTGELEAQIRGSRHAWDIRLISVDALLSLVILKEETEEAETANKIRSILRPLEYTRLDQLIDIMFTTAQDVEEGESNPPPGNDDEKETGWVFTPAKQIQEKRERIIRALEERLNVKLIKKTRATYWDSQQANRIVCTVSKRYEGSHTPYWYAYHPEWDQFLGAGSHGVLVLGTMDLDIAFAIPLSVVRAHLNELNTTTTSEGKTYWHVKVVESETGGFSLHIPTGHHLPLGDFAITLS